MGEWKSEYEFEYREDSEEWAEYWQQRSWLVLLNNLYCRNTSKRVHCCSRMQMTEWHEFQALWLNLLGNIDGLCRRVSISRMQDRLNSFSVLFFGVREWSAGWNSGRFLSRPHLISKLTSRSESHSGHLSSVSSSVAFFIFQSEPILSSWQVYLNGPYSFLHIFK